LIINLGDDDALKNQPQALKVTLFATNKWQKKGDFMYFYTYY